MAETRQDPFHELNQPLAAIANYAQAVARLLASRESDIDEIREALKQICAQVVRAGEIIRRAKNTLHTPVVASSEREITT